MIKMNRLNALVATYNDGASSIAEIQTAQIKGVDMIAKELNCSRWLASNIFTMLAYGDVSFTQYKIDLINKSTGETEILAKVVNGLKQLNIQFRVSTSNSYVTFFKK